MLGHLRTNRRQGDNFFSGIAERVRDLFGGPLSPTLRVDALGQLSQLLAPSIGDHLPDRYHNALAPQSGPPIRA